MACKDGVHELLSAIVLFLFQLQIDLIGRFGWIEIGAAQVLQILLLPFGLIDSRRRVYHRTTALLFCVVLIIFKIGNSNCFGHGWQLCCSLGENFASVFRLALALLLCGLHVISYAFDELFALVGKSRILCRHLFFVDDTRLFPQPRLRSKKYTHVRVNL